LEENNLQSTVEEGAETVETALGSGRLEEHRQWFDSQSDISWLTGLLISFISLRRKLNSS
jgi:hypothetical protein